MSGRIFPLALVASVVPLSLGAATARAADTDPAPLVHPIFAHLPDAPENGTVQQTFTTAAARYNLHPVEVIDVPAPPPPRAPDDVRIGILNTQKLAFDEALHDLDDAAAEVVTTGGAGLTAAELGDLYLYRAMATARADWKAPAAVPPPAPEVPVGLGNLSKLPPPNERLRAFDDYLHAATVTPTRVPNARELPPQAVADFQRALDVVHKRPRGTLVIKGPADALVALDAGPLMPLAGGVTIRDLTFGDHVVRVEQIGYAPWGTVVAFDQPSLDLDVPARAPLALDDATAAAHARRMGARFALVFEPKGGPGAPVELFLVDVATGARRDAAQVATTGEAGQIDAAVMRLDEEARRTLLEQANSPGGVTPLAIAADSTQLGTPVMLAAPPAKAKLSDDPAAWARDHWPLLTAIGVVALTAIVLGATVSSDR